MKECITQPQQTLCDGVVKFSCVFVISLGRRRSSITLRSTFEINESYRCDADVLRCLITKLLFEPAIYNEAKNLAGVDSYKTTKPVRAKSRDTKT